MGAADAEEARKATTANAMHGFSPGPLSPASDSHGSSGLGPGTACRAAGAPSTRVPEHPSEWETPLLLFA